MSAFYNLQKIKVNIEYEGKIKSSEVPPYKPINFIKEVARDLFKNNISPLIKLKYNNKDLTQFEGNIIGDFFKRKNTINIKIEDSSSKYLIESSDKKRNKNNKSRLLCLCNRDYIGSYCRNCKEFICNSCRVNETHLKHKITQIDIDNLVESVKLYAITLQSEIPININKTQENYEKLEKNTNIYDFHTRHNIINEKIENVLNSYNNYLEHLNCDNDNIENVINNYNSETYNLTLDLDDINKELNEKYCKQKKQMNEDEFKEYFRKLSEKEENLKILSYNIIPYTVKDDIKERMKLMYDKIEEILDFTLNNQNPLGVNNEINDLYNFVIQNQIEDEEEVKEEIKEDNNNIIEKNEIEENINNNAEHENSNNEERENEEKERDEKERDQNVLINEDDFNNKKQTEEITNKKSSEEQEKINLRENDILDVNQNEVSNGNIYFENQEIEEKNKPSEN